MTKQPRPEARSLVTMRERVLRATPAEQAHLRAAFAASFPAWCEATAWTYRVKNIDPETGREIPAAQMHVPFTLWPCQVEASEAIIDAISKGEDCVIRKSRDMGASWLLVGIAAWGWLFHGWQSLLVSRVEDLVDRTGDPDTLFWKVDYLLASQPEWLLPATPKALEKGGELRQHMMLRHPTSGATIAGQASTEHIGRGGRRTLVIFDEFAALDHADAAWRSAADCTSCRIANSTPIGAGTEYARLVSTARTQGAPRLVELMYWQHPEKGAGQADRVDEDGAITGFFILLSYLYLHLFVTLKPAIVMTNLICTKQCNGCTNKYPRKWYGKHHSASFLARAISSLSSSGSMCSGGVVGGGPGVQLSSSSGFFHTGIAPKGWLGRP